MNPIRWFFGLSSLARTLSLFGVVLIALSAASAKAVHWHRVQKTKLTDSVAVATETRIATESAAEIAAYASTIQALRDSVQAKLSRTDTVFRVARQHAAANQTASDAVTATIEALKQAQRAETEVADMVAASQRLQSSSLRLQGDVDSLASAVNAERAIRERMQASATQTIQTLGTRIVTVRDSITRDLEAERKRPKRTKRAMAIAGAVGAGVGTVATWLLHSKLSHP